MGFDSPDGGGGGGGGGLEIVDSDTFTQGVNTGSKYDLPNATSDEVYLPAVMITNYDETGNIGNVYQGDPNKVGSRNLCYALEIGRDPMELFIAAGTDTGTVEGIYAIYKPTQP
jgi:hypothetical protein